MKDGGDQETVNDDGGAERDRTADLMLAKHALSQLSYSPVCGPAAEMVGLGRVELPTSPLSGVRSNQLSYRPKVESQPAAPPPALDNLSSLEPGGSHNPHSIQKGFEDKG